MAKRLQNYFPMIRTRKEVLKEIEDREELLAIFETWEAERQKEFLDFCSGIRGVKILYDSFFKELLNPEYHLERLEDIVSQILNRKVKIRQILPNDTVRIADEQSLLITDMIVELEDGSIANLEIQKIGYAFPGQRVACYSADTLLRQYKRVKSERKKKFTYRDIKTVYTIVFFEKSTKEFHSINSKYIHKSTQVFDTGLKLQTLQEYILIPLDIFKENMHNKTVKSKLDAWLAFLAFDEPEWIIQLIDAYPEFKAMYEEIYDMCRNIEGVMKMYSKELAELDRNTVQYMIEEQEIALREQEKELREQEKELHEQEKELHVKEKTIKNQERQIIELQKKLDDLMKMNRH